MSEIQNIKRQLLPLLKGLPFILVVFLGSLWLAKRMINYSTPRYKSTARIKLDDQKIGISQNNLYQDFDVFSSTNKIEAEVELLKSPMLIGMALDKIESGLKCYRVGTIRKTLLYNDCPFEFTPIMVASNWKDIPLTMVVNSNSEITIRTAESGELLGNVVLGDTLMLDGLTLAIAPNEELLSKRKIDVADTYELVIPSRASQISDITGKFLEIMAIEKEVAVIRISYQDESAQRGADFVNALCEAYINDYVSTKSLAAQKTYDFVDERLKEVGQKLAQSEVDVEQYKLANKVVNTRQETETDLRKVSRLKVQLVNLEMNESSLNELEKYVATGSYFDNVAPQFGYGDLLFTELAKKLKQLADEKRDLMLKYTPESDQVLVCEEKIQEIKKYIAEAITSARQELVVKREEIESAIEKADAEFVKYPSRERELTILEREFKLNEASYNFLSQKRMEAAVASAATISFHRVIQKAVPTLEPVSPNKILILFVSGLVGLIVGVGLVLLRNLVRARIRNRDEVERTALRPVLGVLKNHTNGQDEAEAFSTLAGQIIASPGEEKPNIIQVTSALRNEGKTYVSYNLAKALAGLGYSTAWVNADFRASTNNGIGFSDWLTEKVDLDEVVEPQSPFGLVTIETGQETSNPVATFSHKDFANKMEELKNRYDFIVLDSPSTVIAPESIALMGNADLCLFTLRAGETPKTYLNYPDLLCEEHGFDNIKLVLNGAHKAFNFNGRFTGSRFNYSVTGKGVFGLLPHYIKTYIKS